MSLPFKTKNLKVITIDLWNTIFSKGQTDEIYAVICKAYNIPFNEFIEARANVRKECNEMLLQPAQPAYWELIINQTSKKGTVNISAFTKDMNKLYENSYVPGLVYSKIGKFINLLTRQGYTVLILSNTGYLRGYQVEQILSKQFNINVNVVGSDFLGVAKPNPKFYQSCVSDVTKWLHIGDSDTLDIEPVKKLGGSTYKINNVMDWINLHERWLD